MIQWFELVVFAVLFGAVSVMGFLASRWRRAETLEHLDEWGLGGRKFGACSSRVRRYTTATQMTPTGTKANWIQ